MIKDCAGCEEEWEFMIRCLNIGLHFAGEDIDGEHFRVFMVDDDGRIVVE